VNEERNPKKVSNIKVKGKCPRDEDENRLGNMSHRRK
jgi:hypothetical protein